MRLAVPRTPEEAIRSAANARALHWKAYLKAATAAMLDAIYKGRPDKAAYRARGAAHAANRLSQGER